jgi:hypothetical protein
VVHICLDPHDRFTAVLTGAVRLTIFAFRSRLRMRRIAQRVLGYLQRICAPLARSSN